MTARRLVETQLAAKLLGIDEDLIAKWKHRRKVTPARILRGRGRGGQVPLYDLEDLRPLAEAYKRKQARKAARHADGDAR